MAGEGDGDTGGAAPRHAVAHTGGRQGSNHYPVPPLCWLQSMKTTADPGRHAELCYYSNHHHGTRGLDPTSGFAEALSSCPPPSAPFIPQHREGTWPGIHPADTQGGLRPGAGRRT